MRIIVSAIATSALSMLAACGGGGNSAQSNTTNTTETPAVSTVMSPGTRTNTVWNFNMADLNGDGLEDVVVSGWVSDQSTAYVYIFTQNADGTLTDSTATLLPNNAIQGAQRVLISDFDNDGKQDIFMPGFRDGSVILATNSVMFWGSVGAYTRQDFNDQVMAHGACLGDMNGDGKIDAIVAGDGLNSTGGIYINNGDRTFAINNNFSPYGWNSFTACAVIAGTGTNTVYYGNSYYQSPYDVIVKYDHSLNRLSYQGLQTETGPHTIDVLASDYNGLGRKQFVVSMQGQPSATLAVTPAPSYILDAANGLTYTITNNMGTRIPGYHNRLLTIDGVESIFFSGDTQNATIYKGLTEYKPGSFKAMDGTTQNFRAAAVYKNSKTGKIYMLELLDNVFKTQEM